jgi:hypothetical protein
MVEWEGRFQVYKEYKASRANVNKHRGELSKIVREDDDEYEEIYPESYKASRSAKKRITRERRSKYSSG